MLETRRKEEKAMTEQQHVRTGEKGITRCMPMLAKRAARSESHGDETDEPEICHVFCFRAYWFALAQTEGEDAEVLPK
jgi:hypothetical protein